MICGVAMISYLLGVGTGIVVVLHLVNDVGPRW